MKLKSYIREITPPLVWRAARKAKHSVLKNGAQRTGWTYGVEQPAEFYDERFGTLADFHRHYTESRYYPMWIVIADRIRHYGAESVLDIGCGAGQLACLLRDQGLPRYSGLDFSSTRVACARDICPEFDFFVEDVHKTDLIERREYDLVVSTEFLEHIEGDLEVLQRIPRGVRVLATVPNYPATGHVRYFETADAVQRRYEQVLEELSVDTLIMNPSGRVIYVMDGRTPVTPASGGSTITTSFAELRN